METRKIKLCKNCGTKFKPSWSSESFCCRDCKIEYRREYSNNWWRTRRKQLIKKIGLTACFILGLSIVCLSQNLNNYYPLQIGKTFLYEVKTQSEDNPNTLMEYKIISCKYNKSIDKNIYIIQKTNYEKIENNIQEIKTFESLEQDNKGNIYSNFFNGMLLLQDVNWYNIQDKNWYYTIEDIESLVTSYNQYKDLIKITMRNKLNNRMIESWYAKDIGLVKQIISNSVNNFKLEINLLPLFS